MYATTSAPLTGLTPFVSLSSFVSSHCLAQDKGFDCSWSKLRWFEWDSPQLIFSGIWIFGSPVANPFGEVCPGKGSSLEVRSHSQLSPCSLFVVRGMNLQLSPSSSSCHGCPLLHFPAMMVMDSYPLGPWAPNETLSSVHFLCHGVSSRQQERNQDNIFTSLHCFNFLNIFQIYSSAISYTYKMDLDLIHP